MENSGQSGSAPGELLVVKNFIDGEFVDHCGGEWLDSFDPSTGQPWAQIPNSTEQDVEKAVEAASKAFVEWSAKTALQRSALLMRVADLLESRLEELARLESRDQGKPLWLAKSVDIPRAVHNFRFFATFILHDLNRSRIHEPTGAVQYTVKEPVGVAGLISPWNLPLYLLTFKVAPALAAGNTVVAKPSELTSVTAFKLCQLVKEAGVPPGVLNMVFGTGGRAGACLVQHPKVPLVSFTGGTVTAENIRRTASSTCKKLSLELGGKNAAVVFSDADVGKCVSTCIRSSFLNQGEICLCTSRIFVQRDIYQEFLDRFVEAAKKLTVGDPNEDNFMGAVVSKAHLTKIQTAVEGARQHGAAVHQMAEDLYQRLPQRCAGGYFYPPTVITDVEDKCAAMQEEIFGPVTCVVPFDTERENGPSP
ncbi:2-aminomuconic semialdehyde dehydrogenase-like isoform X2 [Babylonia areolata]|uniref:2-aminomuconic semialdehyde dehydrogenase-like isoform X2 n=1 Tax=Babylonia areolata TaxID=304850 RepID=UPI003FD567D0